MEDLETLTPFKFFKAEGTKTRVLNMRLPEIPETAKLHRTNQYSKICPPTHTQFPPFLLCGGRVQRIELRASSTLSLSSILTTKRFYNGEAHILRQK